MQKKFGLIKLLSFLQASKIHEKVAKQWSLDLFDICGNIIIKTREFNDPFEGMVMLWVLLLPF